MIKKLMELLSNQNQKFGLDPVSVIEPPSNLPMIKSVAVKRNTFGQYFVEATLRNYIYWKEIWRLFKTETGYQVKLVALDIDGKIEHEGTLTEDNMKPWNQDREIYDFLVSVYEKRVR